LIHRRGVVFEARLHPPERLPGPGARLHTRRAVVRLSGTFGLPRPLPEWTGLAVRVFDREAEDPSTGNDPSHVLDILLVSSVPEPQLWRQMRPCRIPLASTFTSVTRYQLGGTDQVVVAIPRERRDATLEELVQGEVDCPIHFRLDIAELEGLWRGLGDLELVERRGDDDPSLRFTPSREGLIRRPVYNWFQRR
jgi:hypothetical protein